MRSDTVQQLDRLAAEVEVSWSQGNHGSFEDFVSAVLSLKEDGAVSSFDAARYVAGAAFVPGIDDDPLREEITMVAAQLENPEVPDADGHWRYLQQLVKELPKAG